MWNWQTCGSLSRSSAPIGSSLLLTIFTVPLLPGPFGSAEAGDDRANAKNRIVARIVRRDAALRMLSGLLCLSPSRPAIGRRGAIEPAETRPLRRCQVTLVSRLRVDLAKAGVRGRARLR